MVREVGKDVDGIETEVSRLSGTEAFGVSTHVTVCGFGINSLVLMVLVMTEPEPEARILLSSRERGRRGVIS